MKGCILHVKKYEDALGRHPMWRTPRDDARWMDNSCMWKRMKMPSEDAQQRRHQGDAKPKQDVLNPTSTSPAIENPAHGGHAAPTQPPATATGAAVATVLVGRWR